MSWAARVNRIALLKALVPLVPKESLSVATHFSLVLERWYYPLHHALSHGNEEMIELLLQSGVSCEQDELGLDHESGEMIESFGTYLGYYVGHPTG